MYNRRLVIFLASIGVCVVAAVGRLADMQLLRGKDNAAAIELAMRRQTYLDTARGDILDRNGRTLATDQACYAFRMQYQALLANWAARQERRLAENELLSPAEARQHVQRWISEADELSLLEQWLRGQVRRLAKSEGLSAPEARQAEPAYTEQTLKRIDWTLDRAARVAEVPRESIDQCVDLLISRVWNLKRILKFRLAEEVQSHDVIRNLDQSTHVALHAELPQMLGASLAPSTRRHYPYDELACHVIGVLGKVTAEDLENDPYPGDRLRCYRPDDLLGAAGVEKLCEPILRGLRGEYSHRRGGGEIQNSPAATGENVRLTLDIELQRRLTELMLAQSNNGAAVVLHVPTGDVLALVSTPTYDLNTFRQNYANLAANETNRPLLNRAVAGYYPPGSTAKPIVALASLAAGVISPETIIDCQGALDPDVPTKFRCSSRHGPIMLRDGIKKSCNVYFYQTGSWLGAERMMGWMRLFGFGARPGTGLYAEAAGFTPTAEWLWEQRHRRFTRADAQLMAIGQGLLSATPMQVANAAATIARNGLFLPPRLIDDSNLRDRRTLELPPRVSRDLKLPPATLEAVQDAMFAVVNEPGGTAYKYAFGSPVQICGKSGTSQTSRPGLNTSWFIGYAPRNDPRIAFAIVLEYTPAEESGGGRLCGPLGKELVTICHELEYFNQPDTSTNRNDTGN